MKKKLFLLTIALLCAVRGLGPTPTRAQRGIQVSLAMPCSSLPPAIVITAVVRSTTLGATVSTGRHRPTAATTVTISASVRATGTGTTTVGRSASPFGRSLKNNLSRYSFTQRLAFKSQPLLHLTLQTSLRGRRAVRLFFCRELTRFAV